MYSIVIAVRGFSASAAQCGASCLTRSCTLDVAVLSLEDGASAAAPALLPPSASPQDLETVECLMPNGIILDVLVHPDDELCRIKEVVLSKATTDGS